MNGCHICDLQANTEALPVRERIYLDEHWRLSHGWSSLQGWLVVCARQHVQALDELERGAIASLAPLLAAASGALRDVVGCERTYVVLFAEKPGFRHLHIHVVPRMSWFGDTNIGPGVFRFLDAPQDELVPAPDRDRLAERIGERLSDRLPG